MGSEEEWGSFPKFVEAVANAEITSDGQKVNYVSPSIGSLSFGWDDPFVINGKPQDLRFAYRYDNPYCQAPFDTSEIVIRNGDKSYRIAK